MCGMECPTVQGCLSRSVSADADRELSSTHLTRVRWVKSAGVLGFFGALAFIFSLLIHQSKTGRGGIEGGGVPE